MVKKLKAMSSRKDIVRRRKQPGRLRNMRVLQGRRLRGNRFKTVM